MNRDHDRNNLRQDERFSQFMFGGRQDGTRRKRRQFRRNSIPSIDIEGLIENIDTLRESAQNLKPLVQKAYPLFEQFWKKK